MHVIIFALTIKCDLRNSWERQSIIFTPILFLPIPIFFLFWSVKPSAISFIHFFYIIGLLATSFLSFVHLRMSLFPLHSWQTFLPETEFEVYGSVLSVLENVPLYSGLHGSRREICSHLRWCSPISNVPFLSGCFQDFSLPFVFRLLMVISLNVDFFGIILFEIL